MFARLPDASTTPVRVVIDGRPFEAASNDTVAAALLASGHASFRVSALSGAGRGPYCMMGVCFECLVTIDGQANRQACMVRVEQDMRIETRPVALR